MVRARSCAEMPVVTPKRRCASTETVKAVPCGSVLQSVIGWRARASARLLGQRSADEAPPVLCHEVDRIRRHLLGGAYEVALILTVRVVGDDHHSASGDVADRVVYGVEGHFPRYGTGTAATPLAPRLQAEPRASPRIRRCTYLPIRSASTLAGLATRRWREIRVLPGVGDQSHLADPCPAQPVHREADSVQGDRSVQGGDCPHLWRKAEGEKPRGTRLSNLLQRRDLRPHVPWTRWPPSRSPTLAARSRLTGDPRS